MLKPGTSAPDLRLPDQHGRIVSLAGFHGSKNVVLFFYPKAGTRVCTLEACAFRDVFADLVARDAVVIGVSGDARPALEAFASRWSLPFALLSDPDGKARKAFEVDRLWGLIPGRVTYVVDKGGVVRAAHGSLFEAEGHVQRALQALEGQGTR